MIDWLAGLLTAFWGLGQIREVCSCAKAPFWAMKAPAFLAGAVLIIYALSCVAKMFQHISVMWSGEFSVGWIVLAALAVAQGVWLWRNIKMDGDVV